MLAIAVDRVKHFSQATILEKWFCCYQEAGLMDDPGQITVFDFGAEKQHGFRH